VYLTGGEVKKLACTGCVWTVSAVKNLLPYTIRKKGKTISRPMYLLKRVETFLETNRRGTRVKESGCHKVGRV